MCGALSLPPNFSLLKPRKHTDTTGAGHELKETHARNITHTNTHTTQMPPVQVTNSSNVKVQGVTSLLTQVN